MSAISLCLMTVNYQPSIVQYFWTSIGLIFTPRTCIVFIRLSALLFWYITISPNAAHPPSSPCRYRQLPERAAAQNRSPVGPTVCSPLVVLLNLVNSPSPWKPRGHAVRAHGPGCGVHAAPPAPGPLPLPHEYVPRPRRSCPCPRPRRTCSCVVSAAGK